MDGVAYEAPPLANISVAGAPVIVEVDWHHRSIISKIIVTQTDGIAEAFQVALYNNKQVMTGEHFSDSVGPDVGKIPDDCYRVTPDLTASASGRLLYFSDTSTGGFGFVFFNQNDFVDRRGQKDNKLYVKITPVTSNPKKVAICIGGTIRS